MDVAPFLPFAIEGAKIPKSVPRFHELICAAMYAYRNYRDEKSYPMAIRYLAEGVKEEAWSADARRIVEHWQRYGSRELIGNSRQMRELRERINYVAANRDVRVLILGESGTGKEAVAMQIHNRSRAVTSRSSRSIARALRRISWKTASSGTRRARSRGRTASSRGFSSWRTAERFSSTRSPSFRWRRRGFFFASWRAGDSCESAAERRSRRTCVS